MAERRVGELSRRRLLMTIGAGLVTACTQGCHNRAHIRLTSAATSTEPAPPAATAPAPPSEATPPTMASPDILPCEAWGARNPSEAVTVLDARPTKIVVHHTATPNLNEVSHDDLITLATSIQTWHMDHNGWIDTGQHFTINRGGLAAEGRHRSLETVTAGVSFVEGTHCIDQNDVSIGIENQGTYTEVDPPDALLGTLAALLAYCAGQYQMSPAQIYGHRDFNDTACPGDKLYALLPTLRRRVGQLMGTPVDQAAASPPVWPLLRPGKTGPAVAAAQHLLRAAGQPQVDVTGTFDSDTVSAVTAFQHARGLVPSGVVAGGSWPLLVRSIANDPTGEATAAVRVLRAHTGSPTNAEGEQALNSTATTTTAWQRLLDAADS